ncbi:MAG: hypothetical protein N2383_10210 [Caldilineales bacterium]|nr:hypothetical protein [Caldilineales bacterium]
MGPFLPSLQIPRHGHEGQRRGRQDRADHAVGRQLSLQQAQLRGLRWRGWAAGRANLGSQQPQLLARRPGGEHPQQEGRNAG